MSPQEIRDALVETINELNYTIKQVKKDFPENPYLVQYSSGQYVLLTAMSAKAQALSALAILEASK